MWIVSWVGSILVDFIIERKIMPKTLARKVANTLAMMVPAIALLGTERVIYMMMTPSACHPQGPHLLVTAPAWP